MDGMYPYKSFFMELLEILSSWYILSFCVLSFMQAVIWECKQLHDQSWT